MYDMSAEAKDYARTEWIDWERLEESTILITGATGLVGSWCARVLLERNRTAKARMRIVCLVRNTAKLALVLGDYGADDGLSVLEGDLLSATLSGLEFDYCIHAACPTASSYFVDCPVETADAVVLGTRRLLGAARGAHARGFVYVSSMEVYGRGRGSAGSAALLSEAEVGLVDPLSVRSSYSEGKRMAEQYCAAYAAEYSVPTAVVRLAQTFGPGVSPEDSRLFALCARCAVAGDDIVLRTTGKSTRMYLYVGDAVTAILTALLAGEPGRAYNAANPNTYSSVRGMAEYVAERYSNGRTHVHCEVDPDAPFPPEHHLPLDISALAALGWHPEAGFDVMYDNLIASFGGQV